MLEGKIGRGFPSGENGFDRGMAEGKRELIVSIPPRAKLLF